MSATGESSEAGETLIEALVVVAITTLVAMIGLPRMQQGLLSISQHQTVAVVAGRLRQARAEALATDRAVGFFVAGNHRAYARSGEAFAPSPPGVDLEIRPGAEIAFYGDGSSSGGAVWVSAGRRSTPVSVSAATGAVSIGTP